MWEKRERKEGFPRLQEPGEIATKIATLCNSLQNNKHIMVGTTKDSRERGSASCEKF